MKRTDEPTKSKSLEGKFYLKTVAKLLSEKPEDISVVDLGGSLFNSRIAYYDDTTKTIYLIESSDGGINLITIKMMKEKNEKPLNIYNLIPVTDSVKINQNEDELKRLLFDSIRKDFEDSTLSDNLKKDDFVPFVKNYLKSINIKVDEGYKSILFLLELGLKAKDVRKSENFMKYLQKVTLEQFDYLKENPLDNKFFFPSILILFEIDDIMSGNLSDEVADFVEKSGIKTLLESDWFGIDIQLHFILKEMARLGYLKKKYFSNNPERIISTEKATKYISTVERYELMDYNFLKESPFCRSDIYTMFNKREELPDIFYKFFKEEKKILGKTRSIRCCDYFSKENKSLSLLELHKKKIFSVTFDYEEGNPLNESGALSEVYFKKNVLSKLKNKGAKFSDVLKNYYKLISNEHIDFFLYKYDQSYLRDTIDGIIEEAKSDLREDLEKEFSLEREDLERTIQYKDDEVDSLNQEIDDLRDEISRLES